MDLVLQSILVGFEKCYGLDWATMFLGITGAYFLTRRDKRGIVLNFLSCCTAFLLAIICDQYGYIIYNVIFAVMMARAYQKWSSESEQQPA